MRYFVHCDRLFRKNQLITSKLNFLDLPNEENPRNLNIVTFLYGYTYSKINKAFSHMNIRVNRRNPDEISKCLTYTDCVVLFHNFVEYENGMQSIIDTCMKYDIPLVIYSDHIKKGFLTNIQGELTITNEFPHIVKNETVVKVEDFNFKPYTFVPNLTYKQVVELTRKNYIELDKERLDKKIKYYDNSLSLKKS